MDALLKVNEDVNTLFSITDILIQCFRYQQIYNYASTILAYLRDSLTYMRLGCHTHNGICWCTYDQHIVTQYIASKRTQKYTQTHQNSTSFNNVPAHIIRWQPPFLLVPYTTWTHSRWPIFTPHHQCTYKGQSTIAPKYMKFSTCQSQMATFQLSTILTTNR